MSNSRENLNCLGGEPTWVEDAEYPECPACGDLMAHLMQLDSDLPTADGASGSGAAGASGTSPGATAARSAACCGNAPDGRVAEMNLITEPYIAQRARWPRSGRHILAQFDAESVVVYQAYRPEIGHFAARHGYFGGGFGLGRMSWIKPNFLWMMYRSGWGTKEDQEVTLAVRLRRDAFDEILGLAVHSTFVPRSLRERRGVEAGRRRLRRAAAMGPRPRAVGQPRRAAGDPTRPAGRRPGPVRQGMAARHRGHLRVRREQRANAKAPYERLSRPGRTSTRSPSPRSPHGSECPGPMAVTEADDPVDPLDSIVLTPAPRDGPRARSPARIAATVDLGVRTVTSSPAGRGRRPGSRPATRRGGALPDQVGALVGPSRG